MGASQRQALTERRATILAAMGVQVWYKRDAAGARPPAIKESVETAETPEANTPKETKPTQETKLTKETIETTKQAAETSKEQLAAQHNKKTDEAADQSTSRALAEPPKAAAVQLVHFGWMKSSHGLLAVPLGLDRTAAVFMREILAYVDWQAGVTPSKTTSGEFRWPQLLDTTEGNPSRALTVFFDKHFGEQRPWVGVAEEVAPDLINWLQDLPVNMVPIPSVQRALADPSAKQALWQNLQRN